MMIKKKHVGDDIVAPSVLIVSSALDLATESVTSILKCKGINFLTLNTEEFPFDVPVSVELLNSSNELKVFFSSKNSDIRSLDSLSSVWYRRVRAPSKPQTMNVGVYDFCLRESRATLLGSLLSKNVPIMSPVEKVWAAEQKVFQLFSAKKIGFKIPETFITNDAQKIRQAFEYFSGQMIAKPVRTGYVDYGDTQHAIYTSVVSKDHLDDLSGANLSPSIFQPLIPKKCDVRITYIDGQIFVAEIDSQKDISSMIDWRKTNDPHLPHRRGKLPDELNDRIRQYMKFLGLKFGAIDFIRTPEDDYVFLEVNPNGQWLWLDDQLEFGISESLANWLIQPQFRGRD